jgi:ferredoxin
MTTLLTAADESRASPTSDSPATVRVILHGTDGETGIDVPEGEALLWSLKRAGLPLAAICGGKGACGTCRVTIPLAWHPLLPEVSRRERRLLDHLKSAEGDRLACRLVMEPALAGLPIHPSNPSQGDK